jgi:hypothetical protein
VADWRQEVWFKGKICYFLTCFIVNSIRFAFWLASHITNEDVDGVRGSHPLVRTLIIPQSPCYVCSYIDYGYHVLIISLKLTS